MFTMGTRLDLVLAGVSREQSDAVAAGVKAECERIEGMLSIYRSGSPVSLLNSAAHLGWMKTDRELHALLEEIRSYHHATGGYFDITMKPVADFYRMHPPGLPVEGEVRERTGMDLVLMGADGIRFARKGVFLDLGGYGKGYAVKKMLPILEAYGIGHALISFGESLVYGWGSHPYGDAWPINLPCESEDGPVRFNLRDEALSTSGNSLNNQKKFANSGHIVNPLTLEMCRQRGLVSVKAGDPVHCEVYSTALFSAGPGKEEAVLAHAPDLEVRWIGWGE
jgi:thiamine biosynthesis lipoprotein